MLVHPFKFEPNLHKLVVKALQTGGYTGYGKTLLALGTISRYQKNANMLFPYLTGNMLHTLETGYTILPIVELVCYTYNTRAKSFDYNDFFKTLGEELPDWDIKKYLSQTIEGEFSYIPVSASLEYKGIEIRIKFVDMKYKLAKSMADQISCEMRAMDRFDMSDYNIRHNELVRQLYFSIESTIGYEKE